MASDEDGHQRIQYISGGSAIGLILGMINSMSKEHIIFMVVLSGLMGFFFHRKIELALKMRNRSHAYMDFKSQIPSEIIHAVNSMEKAVDIRMRNRALLDQFQDLQLKLSLISGTSPQGLLHVALQNIETELHQSQAELQRASMLEASARDIMAGIYDDIEQAYLRTL
jgi:hypothetical protein